MSTSLLRKSVTKRTIGLLIAHRTYQGAYEHIMLMLQQENIDYLILNPCFSTDENGASTQEESYFGFEISFSTPQEEEALAKIIQETHVELYPIPIDRNDVVAVVKKKQQAKLFFQDELVKEGEYAVIQQIADEFATWYRLPISIKEDMNLMIQPFTDEMTIGKHKTPVVSKETMKDAMTTIFEMMDNKSLTAEEFVYRHNPLNERYEIFIKSDVHIPHVKLVEKEEQQEQGTHDKWTINWIDETGSHYNLSFEDAVGAYNHVQALKESGVDGTLIVIFKPRSNVSEEMLKSCALKNE